VTRPGLLTNTATTMAVNFRSCRDSGITWLALSGLDVARIQRGAGHDDVQTTLAYVKTLEDIKGKVGIPFPPLPVELLGQASGQVPSDRQKAPRKWAPTAGLEQAGIAKATLAHADSRGEPAAPVDASPPSAATVGPSGGPSPTGGDEVEAALAKALDAAAAAGRFDVVALLAGELQARRLAASGFLSCPPKRAGEAHRR
jgi:hypothetical protein